MNRRGPKKYVPEEELHPERLKFDRDGFWTESLKRQFTFQREHVATNSYIMIKVMDDDPKHQRAVIDAANLESPNWLYGCKASYVYKDTRICESGENLSGKFTALAPSRGKRRVAHVNLKKMAEEFGYTHLVVFVPKHSEHVKVNIDVFRVKDRSISYSVPRWISFWNAYPVVEKTVYKAVYYNVSLKDVDEMWQAYNIKVTPLGKCADEEHFGYMRMVTPWARDATQALIEGNATTQLVARLQSPRPKDGAYYRNPEMRVYLNPSCRYKIEIQSSLPAMFGQIARFYGPMLVPLSIAATLVTLSQQLRGLESDYAMPSFLTTLSKKVTPVSVVMPGRILSSLLSMGAIAVYVPATDFVRLVDAGIDFAVLPIVLFFVCIGLVGIIAAAAWACVVAFGSAANKAAVRFVASYANLQNELFAEAALSGVSKFPFILSGVLLAVSVATCGDVGLCLGTFCNFIHLFDLYKDYAHCILRELSGIEGEDRREKTAKAKAALLDSLHFQFTLSLLWAFAAVLNAPSLLAWSRIAITGAQLSPDPSLVPAVFLSVSLAATWGAGRPDPERAGYGKLALGLQFLAVMVVTYGSISMYRVNYFLSAAFVVVAGHQLIASKRPSKEEHEAAGNNLEGWNMQPALC